MRGEKDAEHFSASAVAGLVAGDDVMAAAERGGILVSRTVKDLVVGSGIEFADRGTHDLKGVPGEWQLFEVVAAP